MFKFTMLKPSVLALLLTFAISAPVQGQIGKIKSLKNKATKTTRDVKSTKSDVTRTTNEVKDARDDAKAAVYSASPAKNELIKADRNVEKLNGFFKTANWDKPDSVETARKIGQELNMFRNNIDQIKEKDPKWKVTKYEEKYGEWYGIYDKETYDPWVRGPAAAELKIMKGVFYQLGRIMTEAKEGGEEYWFSSSSRNKFKKRLDQSKESMDAAKGKDVKQEVNYVNYDRDYNAAKSLYDVEAPKGAKAGALYDYFSIKRRVNVFWDKNWSVDKLQSMYYGDDYLASATEFNASEVRTKLEEFIASKPGEKDKENGYYQYFTAQLDGYRALPFLANAKESVLIDMKNANDAKASGDWGKAICCAANAVNWCKGVLAMDAENPDFQPLLGQATSTYDAIKVAYDSKIWAGDYHKANVGTVKFSKSRPSFGKESGHAWSNAFADGDNIYAMYFLPYGVKDLNKLKIKLFADGEEIADLNHYGEEKDVKAGSAILGVLPAKIPTDKEANMYYWSAGLRALKKLTTGSHKVSVKVFANVECSGEEQIAEGEFTMNTATLSPGIEKIEADLKQQLVDRVRMPRAKYQNSGIEAGIKKAFLDRYGNEDVGQVLRITIQTKAWWVSKNRWGLIEERSHTAAVAYKRKDGTCRFERADFSQNYEGLGKYGSYIYWDGIYDNYEINCDNVFK
ncbi:MAG: hypothetical protein AAGN35_27345 [Bacteroidota bacterium]